ncbi:hypothetical protein EIP91_007448 [Steccherinum ochraceum]|uniref:NADH:flavin oxidoreductase/NADH oxidase N-terminal domain-containing protein n=1 Tax=Steccherinum ochraceum TaxID=92696 RepID=A0A4R0RYU0_9APHY|nr:hypothetical protein EIP91_007448 [Steccherinum ochraceum]
MTITTSTMFDIESPRVLGAPSVPYYIPDQPVAAGTAVVGQSEGIPELFKPLTIRGVTFQNRIFVSPMAQYSVADGFPSPWHTAYIGGTVIRGPGLTFVEATAVSPAGRVTPEDTGIWSDAHAAAHKPFTDLAHSQNQKIGIQLVHGGRKSSVQTLWLAHPNATVPKDAGGWPDQIYAPSAIRYADYMPMPKEMTREDIKTVVEEFRAAARRAVEVGFDVVELHGAHGFLLSSFISPTSNQRTDEYGGSWDNRIRFNLEVIDAVRSVMPESMPLFYRISATEYLEDLPEPSWKIQDTVKFAEIISTHGVDLIDLSAGGNDSRQEVRLGHLHHVPFAQAVKNAHGDRLVVGAVGGIANGNDAQDVLSEGKADVVSVGRYFQKNPGAVWKFAEDLGVDIVLPYQIEWPTVGRGESVQRRAVALLFGAGSE